MKYIIQTPRIGLRNWLKKDHVPFAEMNADPEVMKYFPSVWSRSSSEMVLKKHHKFIDDSGFGFFAAEHLQDGCFIGFVGFSPVRFESTFTPCVEIGWRLVKKYWNRGFATEAAQACLKYAFDHLALSEIYSFTAIQNAPSERVMQKIRMEKVGEFDHPLVAPESGLQRHVLYRITKSLYFT